MKHFKTLLLLSLVLCIHFSLAQKVKRNKCPRNGALFKCSTEFQGVCAFFKENRRDISLSQKYSANSCIACMDSRVRYTVEGACNGDKVFCDANIRPEACTKEYFPVCGYNSKCKGDNCGIPAGNKCMACANPEIEWYVQGECPDAPSNEVVCDPKNRPEICPAIYQPVCATVKTCKGKVCTTTTRTEGSGCTACGNPDVISYVPGECAPVSTQCDPKNRPEFCPEIYNPVCATLKDCRGGSCTQTAGNACNACSDPNVISYIPGKCPIVPTQCDPKNRPQACIEIYQPVCATLQVCNGDSCTQTAENACIACSDPNVVSHVPGECPIVVTQCDPNNRPEFCTDIYQPVCATIEVCTRRGCSQRTRTIANGCDACATANVVSHVPGECPA